MASPSRSSIEPVRSTAERSTIDAIRRILRALRLSANATQSTLGISAAQLYVLRQLADHEAASISDLAALTLTDRSSVAAVVDRLVEQGLALRSPSPTDRRRASVRISDKGRRLSAAGPPAPTDMLRAAVRSLSDEQLLELAQALNTLVSAMGLESTPVEMLFELGGSTSDVRTKGRNS